MVKTRKPKVAGILNMVSGFTLGMVSFGAFMDVINAGKFEMAWWLLLIIPGILALISGIYSLESKKWGLVLLGSICAIICGLGILSVIFISMSKKEFA